MPTTTTPRRAPRAGTPRRAAATRRAPASRPTIPLRRSKPQPKSRGGQLLGLVSKALPPAAAAKKVKPTGKGRNLALLGVAGGIAAAIKNRDKLSFGGKGAQEPAPVEPVVPVSPVAPEAPTSDIGGTRPAI